MGEFSFGPFGWWYTIIPVVICRHNGDLRMRTSTIRSIALLASLTPALVLAGAPRGSQERMVEWTIESRQAYADPFNEVDVDVVFSKGGQTWRVPTFWRGGQRWTVRFAPPSPGEYTYRLQSTDAGNADLNGHEGRVSIAAYAGSNELLRHGMLRVSANRRFFEHADGTPFHWLGDTWWTGLSDRLSWEGYQKLTADRKAKGFTVVQMVAGLVPVEELAPVDAGFHNEGGFVWEESFARINPEYFDYADRRIQHLLEAGMVPALVGAWANLLDEMGVARMKKHWRYMIARYGAYPVFWIAGGEVVDPPADAVNKVAAGRRSKIPGGWTEVARYIRATDPYRHPLTVHEDYLPANAFPVQDEGLMDFDCLQPSHFGWKSMAAGVAQVNMHYARTTVRKPVVQCEIGYEGLGNYHLQDFQRAAFWLMMLNGAAGHTYGAVGTWESYTAEKPFHRMKWSLTTWDEGMTLPGAYQVGIGAKLLARYPWWRFEPHPEWVAPRGVTVLEPRADINGFDASFNYEQMADPRGESATDSGTVFAPYAAGIPKEVRFIYSPSFGFAPLNGRPLATVLGLEPGIRYTAWFWDPTHGTKIDLGSVERPAPGALIPADGIENGKSIAWTHHGSVSHSSGALIARGKTLSVLSTLREQDLVASVRIRGGTDAALLLRYQDESNYVAAVYSAKDSSIHLLERSAGVDGAPLGRTALSPVAGDDIQLTAEVRDAAAIVSLTDGRRSYTSPIVDIQQTAAGMVALLHQAPDVSQRFAELQLRKSPAIAADERLELKLYDAAGRYRGEMDGPSSPARPARGLAAWEEVVRNKHILLDAFRPHGLPYSSDWVLVLETAP